MLRTNVIYKDLEISIHGIKFPATLVAIESPWIGYNTGDGLVGTTSGVYELWH
jgi:hypothetical protein